MRRMFFLILVLIVTQNVYAADVTTTIANKRLKAISDKAAELEDITPPETQAEILAWAEIQQHNFWRELYNEYISEPTEYTKYVVSKEQKTDSEFGTKR